MDGVEMLDFRQIMSYNFPVNPAQNLSHEIYCIQFLEIS